MAELLEKLWPALLGKEGNASYWFHGSDINNSSMEEGSAPLGLFQIALLGARHKEEEDLIDREDEDETQAVLAKLSGREQDMALWEHKLLRYDLDCMPTELVRVLRNGSPPGTAQVCTVYEECQGILYALNRYVGDDFSKSLTELNSVVAKLLGRCFHHFTTDDAFRHAWYIMHTMRRLVNNRFILQWWMEQYLHHDARVDSGQSVAEAHDSYVELQRKQKLTTNECVLAALGVLGLRYHRVKEHKNFLAMARQHNRKHPDDKINVAQIARIFAAINRKHAEKESEQEGIFSFPYCLMTDQFLGEAAGIQ